MHQVKTIKMAVMTKNISMNYYLITLFQFNKVLHLEKFKHISIRN